MAYAPACTGISGIEITQPDPASINVKWNGVATSYLLSYKRQEESVYVSQWLTGPGSSGGSGLNTNDTGGVPGVGAVNLSADFTIPGVTPGIYDLRLFNICDDGSNYERLEKFTVHPDVGTIPNLHLVSKNELEIRVGWGNPTIDSGEPIIISWCELDPGGLATACESRQLLPGDRTYVIPHPSHNRYRVWVAQMHNENSHSTSLPLHIYLCKCGQGGSDFVGAANYVHDQEAPEDIWLINHNLGYYPNVTATDRFGKEMGGVVQYIDPDNLEVHFGEDVAGFGYLS